MFKKITEFLIDLEEKITRKFNPLQKKFWNIFLFLVTFASFSLVLHFLVWLNWSPLFLQRLNALIVSEILNLLQLKSEVIGVYIKISSLGLIEIVKDCLGWKSFLALSGLIFATRKITLKNKFFGILIGLLIIFIVNIIRLVTTFYLAAKFGLNFDIIHTFIWRWGLTLFILIIWLFWLRINLKSIKN